MTEQLSQQRAYPAASEFAHFASEVAAHLKATERGWFYQPKSPTALQNQREDQQLIHLDLTPFIGTAQPADAAYWFSTVKTIDQLLVAHQQAKAACTTEPSQHVHAYAAAYLQHRFNAARSQYSDTDAQLIAGWVSDLDVYAAVKCVECLLDCYDNLALFKLADYKGWQVLFDHLAIRCGSSQHRHAEQVIEQLQQQHGYVQSQVEYERFYQFDDGWNAYPLYKMLDNGQVIRLFIDQSDADAPRQIIQHWNHCYGFTAHHMALRVVRAENEQCVAVPLLEVIAALTEAGVASLTPTGFYTHGLLEQVFLKPHLNREVPEDIRQLLTSIDPALNKTIENGKLIELVSRRELAKDQAQKLLNLYGVIPSNKPLSAPIYPYFLPAQAAHVIRTSLQSTAGED
jgi:hypothetical protein